MSPAIDPAPQETAALQVWASFVEMLKEGPVSAIPVRPYHPELLEPLRAILENLRQGSDGNEWAAQPAVHIVEDRAHFTLDLTRAGERATYCFSFLLAGGGWYFQHLETITLRLDRLDPLPTSRFPDLPEPQKAWMREEIRVGDLVRLYGWLVREKGRGFALDWFRDGAGYALAAESWVPYVPAHRAFILYLCWEQSNLRGSAVTLLELSDRIARVEIAPPQIRAVQAHRTPEDADHLRRLSQPVRERLVRPGTGGRVAGGVRLPGRDLRDGLPEGLLLRPIWAYGATCTKYGKVVVC